MHYLAVKGFSPLLKGITSKHNGGFYCLNCFYSFTTENVLEEHENVCKDHYYCYVEMSDKDNNVLKYNPGEKSMKVPFIICADLECLLENISISHNDPEISSTTPSGYSLFTQCSFNTTKNSEFDCYKGEDCM